MPDPTFHRLGGQRVALRRFGPDDATTFAGYRSDPEVARHQSWSVPYPVTAAEAFIDWLADAHPDTPGEWFQFAVEEVATRRHVGDVAAHVDGDDPRLARIGVTLAREAQGRGFATEACELLLDYLVGACGKHRVVADCDPRNDAVVALLERLGMRREAHHLQSWWDEDEQAWTDEYVYAVLAAEWSERV